MSQAFEVVGPSSNNPSALTLIEFILDETGSMSHVRDATIGSFNEFINSQRNTQAGDCYLTLTKFDQRSNNGGFGIAAMAGAMYKSVRSAAPIQTTVMPDAAVVDTQSDVRTMYTDVPIDKVEYLSSATYAPNGMTNLYDAVGARIQALSARAAQYEGAAKLIVIMTDGQDNCSREYNADSLKALIQQKEAEGWTFVFLGANQDAWAVGQTFGMSKGNTMTYDMNNIGGAMETLATATASYRGMYASGGLESTQAYKGFFDAEKKDK